MKITFGKNVIVMDKFGNKVVYIFRGTSMKINLVKTIVAMALMIFASTGHAEQLQSFAQQEDTIQVDGSGVDECIEQAISDAARRAELAAFGYLLAVDACLRIQGPNLGRCRSVARGEFESKMKKIEADFLAAVAACEGKNQTGDTASGTIITFE